MPAVSSGRCCRPTPQETTRSPETYGCLAHLVLIALLFIGLEMLSSGFVVLFFGIGCLGAAIAAGAI